MDETITLVGKWKKEDIVLHVSPQLTILDVKTMIFEQTRVQPARQKLVGINQGGKLGKLP